MDVLCLWQLRSRPAPVVLLLLALAWPLRSRAQAPDVPIYRQGRHENRLDDAVQEEAKQLFAGTNAIKLDTVREQLKRSECRLLLPTPRLAPLQTPEIYRLARRSHLRVGWSYICDKCDQWQVNLAGGYVLAGNGAVATCYHVARPPPDIKAGCLVAADEQGRVWPVTAILAANRYSDVCILQVQADGLVPLPLNTNVSPGDAAYCYSDPLDHRGYFSAGIVNRFYRFPGRRPFGAPESAAYAPTRLNVSTDWAPGSSGSAVLDSCGNIIGHVSTITSYLDEEEADPEASRPVGPTMIVFHEAVAAADVLRLVHSQEP